VRRSGKEKRKFLPSQFVMEDWLRKFSKESEAPKEKSPRKRAGAKKTSAKDCGKAGWKREKC